MATTHLFGTGPGDALDLTDSLRWKKVTGSWRANITREFSNNGFCGVCTTTILKESRMNYLTLPYVVRAIGDSQFEAANNRNAFLAMCDKAKKFALRRVGAPVYIIYATENQSPPDIFTIMDFDVSWDDHAFEAANDIPIYTVNVTMYGMPGQILPEGLCTE